MRKFSRTEIFLFGVLLGFILTILITCSVLGNIERKHNEELSGLKKPQNELVVIELKKIIKSLEE